MLSEKMANDAVGGNDNLTTASRAKITAATIISKTSSYLRWPHVVWALMFLFLSITWRGSNEQEYHQQHKQILLPRYSRGADFSSNANDSPMSMTLRDVLNDSERGYHLAMAPSYFGLFGYVGALAAWEDHVGRQVLTAQTIRSVAGASSGGLAAMLLGAGIPPRRAAEFFFELTFAKLADFPGFGALFRGNKLEQIIHGFLQSELPGKKCALEESLLPIALTAFDLKTMEGLILKSGSMARAARASGAYPLMFQPVIWHGDESDYLLIDGGVTDRLGLNGLDSFLRNSSSPSPSRVINLIVGDFAASGPPGPSSLPGNPEVISISIQNLPHVGPFCIEVGPKAVEASRAAMAASLDVPLYRGREDNHYELHIDASSFWSN